MSANLNRVPLLLFLGLACLAGAAGVAWMSSPATLRPARGESADATATFESRLFGLVALGAPDQVHYVRSASLVRSERTSSRSNVQTRLVFDTTGGPVDLGYTQQLFVRDIDAIRTFFEDPSQREATVSSIRRGSELVRFAAAQLAAIFLLLRGLGLWWMCVRALLPSDDDVRIREPGRR